MKLNLPILTYKTLLNPKHQSSLAGLINLFNNLSDKETQVRNGQILWNLYYFFAKRIRCKCKSIILSSKKIYPQALKNTKVASIFSRMLY